MEVAPKVFVSYSWDSNEHNEWVSKFVSKLRSNGVDAKYDRLLTQRGTTNLDKMMVEEIKNSDYVLVILTEKYAEKANNHEGGVGFETQLLITESRKNLQKIIPIVRVTEGKAENVIPYYLQSAHYIDFSNSSNFDDSYEHLFYRIYKTDMITKTLESKKCESVKCHFTLSIAATPYNKLFIRFS